MPATDHDDEAVHQPKSEPVSAVAVVEAHRRALVALDAEAFVACFAEAGAIWDPVGSPPARGRAALRKWFWNKLGDVDQFVRHDDLVIVDGHGGVAVAWSGHLVDRSGHRADVSGIDVLVVDEAARILDAHTFWSSLTAIR